MAVLSHIHQSTKFTSPPIFHAIGYIVYIIPHYIIPLHTTDSPAHVGDAVLLSGTAGPVRTGVLHKGSYYERRRERERESIIFYYDLSFTF